MTTGILPGREYGRKEKPHDPSLIYPLANRKQDSTKLGVAIVFEIGAYAGLLMFTWSYTMRPDGTDTNVESMHDRALK